MRQPSRQDTAIQTNLVETPIAPGVVQVLHLSGNPNLPNEELRDYELGYRSDFSRSLSLDVSAFLSYYRRLPTFEPGAPVYIPGPVLEVLIPSSYESKARATDYGGEAVLNWNVNSRWRISPGYAWLHAGVRQDPSSQGTMLYIPSTGFPSKMFQVRSILNLARNIQFDQAVYYTARLLGSSIPATRAWISGSRAGSARRQNSA